MISYQAISRSVRDRLLEAFNDTCQYFIHNDVKFIYYLSLEFLIGRCLQNALVNLQVNFFIKLIINIYIYILIFLFFSSKVLILKLLLSLVIN